MGPTAGTLFNFLKVTIDTRISGLDTIRLGGYVGLAETGSRVPLCTTGYALASMLICVAVG